MKEIVENDELKSNYGKIIKESIDILNHLGRMYDFKIDESYVLRVKIENMDFDLKRRDRNVDIKLNLIEFSEFDLEYRYTYA